MSFLQIPKLTEGREYIMRISAENMYGISDPLESEEMRAKDLFSTFFSYTAKTLLLFHTSAAINLFQIHSSIIFRRIYQIFNVSK